MIAKDATLAEEVLPGAGYLKAEVLYSVTHEGARTLVDVLARRLRLAMETSDHGLSIAQDVAELIAPTLEWKKTDIKREVTAFERYVASEMAAI